MSRIVVKLSSGNCNCLRQIGSALRTADILGLDEVQIFRHHILENLVLKPNTKTTIKKWFPHWFCNKVVFIRREDGQFLIPRSWRAIYSRQPSPLNVEGEEPYANQHFFKYADFAPKIYAAADKILEGLPADFYAMHIRVGDFADYLRFVDTDKFVRRAAEIFEAGHTLVVACEDVGVFNEIEAVCPNAIHITRPDHNPHYNSKITGSETDDLIELAVLCRAKYFIGTEGSSYSEFALAACGEGEFIATEPQKVKPRKPWLIRNTVRLMMKLGIYHPLKAFLFRNKTMNP